MEYQSNLSTVTIQRIVHLIIYYMNPNDFERFLFGLRPHRNDKQSRCVNFYDAKLKEIYQKYCHFDDAKLGEIHNIISYHKFLILNIFD